MSTTQGLQVFSANGAISVDLTEGLSKYLGEADIYPTLSSDNCSGFLPTEYIIENNFLATYNIVKKVYLNNITFPQDNVAFVLPSVRLYRDTGNRYKIKWEYYCGYNTVGSSYRMSQVNLPVRVMYGFWCGDY